MKFCDKQLLIFDLDGTLVDSAPDLALSINEMLSKLNRATFSEQKIRGWVGNGAQVLVKRALVGATVVPEHIPDANVEQALEIFLASYQKNICVHSALYPGVKMTLQQLKSQGYRLAIVTNKPLVFVEPLLAGLGLDNLFELILGGDSLPKRKPDPMPLLHVCQTLDISPKNCVMIGDSSNDIIAAKAANMDSIGLTYGYNYAKPIADDNPDLVLEVFSGLCEVLDN